MQLRCCQLDHPPLDRTTEGVPDRQHGWSDMSDSHMVTSRSDQHHKAAHGDPSLIGTVGPRLVYRHLVRHRHLGFPPRAFLGAHRASVTSVRGTGLGCDRRAEDSEVELTGSCVSVLNASSVALGKATAPSGRRCG